MFSPNHLTYAMDYNQINAKMSTRENLHEKWSFTMKIRKKLMLLNSTLSVKYPEHSREFRAKVRAQIQCASCPDEFADSISV